jgi:hypothetical protein
VEQALRGAAHRAAPRRLAGLGSGLADFERALADPVDPAITSAEIASELRRAPAAPDGARQRPASRPILVRGHSRPTPGTPGGSRQPSSSRAGPRSRWTRRTPARGRCPSRRWRYGRGRRRPGSGRAPPLISTAAVSRARMPRPRTVNMPAACPIKRQTTCPGSHSRATYAIADLGFSCTATCQSQPSKLVIGVQWMVGKLLRICRSVPGCVPDRTGSRSCLAGGRLRRRSERVHNDSRQARHGRLGSGVWPGFV